MQQILSSGHVRGWHGRQPIADLWLCLAYYPYAVAGPDLQQLQDLRPYFGVSTYLTIYIVLYHKAEYLKKEQQTYVS